MQSQPQNPAEAYERYYVPAMFQPWAQALVEQATLRAGEQVLDVACGTGIVARTAAPLVGGEGTVTGVDLNADMLAVARALPAPSGATIHYQAGNAQSLPFADESFDVTLCQHALSFFPDRVSALREMRRVLRPTGRALVMVLQSIERHAVFRALIESVARQLAIPLSAVNIPFALNSADELRALYLSAGFASVEIREVSIAVEFPEPERFVPLAVRSSAAAVPAFAQLESSAQKTLLDAVRAEVAPTLEAYRRGDKLTFPMFSHVALGHG